LTEEKDTSPWKQKYKSQHEWHWDSERMTETLTTFIKLENKNKCATASSTSWVSVVANRGWTKGVHSYKCRFDADVDNKTSGCVGIGLCDNEIELSGDISVQGTGYFAFGDINYSHGRSHPTDRYNANDIVTVEADMDRKVVSYYLNGEVKAKDLPIMSSKSEVTPSKIFPAVSLYRAKITLLGVDSK